MKETMSQEEPSKNIEEIRKIVLRLLARQEKRIVRQLSERETELEKAHCWEEWFHQGKLLQSRFFDLKKGLNSIDIPDWNKEMEPTTILLDPLKDPQENLSRYFKQSKKLQKAIPHLEKQVAARREELEQHLIAKNLVETTMEMEFLTQWLPNPTAEKEKKLAREVKKALPYLEVTSSAGVPIFVGKSGRANDQLTFQIAHGNDWWLHVAGMPGSHVVIRHPAPDKATIEEAMILAIKHSKAKASGEGEVIVTQKKYVSKVPKGKPGQVQISKHKTYYQKMR